MSRKKKGELPMPEKTESDETKYVFSAMEFIGIRGAIGNWPMQTVAQQRFVDELDDLFTLTQEEQERAGYRMTAGILTENGLQESYTLERPSVPIERTLNKVQVTRLVRVLTAHEIQRWRKRHYDMLIKPIVNRLGGVAVEM